MAQIDYVNDINLKNSLDIIEIKDAADGYKQLSQIAAVTEDSAIKVVTLRADVDAIQNYSEAITGTTGTIVSATHGLGAIQALIVQIYDDANNLVHGAQINNTAGDITWTTTATMAANSYIVIGR